MLSIFSFSLPLVFSSGKYDDENLTLVFADSGASTTLKQHTRYDGRDGNTYFSIKLKSERTSVEERTERNASGRYCRNSISDTDRAASRCVKGAHGQEERTCRFTDHCRFTAPWRLSMKNLIHDSQRIMTIIADVGSIYANTRPRPVITIETFKNEIYRCVPIQSKRVFFYFFFFCHN